MSDLLNNLSTYSPWLLPGVFLLFGISSSLHCVGMCGPLSMLASRGERGSWLYQLGRLTGYLSLGIILSLLGRETLNLILPRLGFGAWYLMAFTLLLSLLLIFSPTAKAFFTKILDRSSRKFMSSALKQENRKAKAFAIGLSSVFLPCGVLYLAIISVVALSSPFLTVLGIFFFWMGTLPLLHFGLPHLKKLLDRFSMKASRFNAFLVIVLCALVLFSRYPHLMAGATAAPHCH